VTRVTKLIPRIKYGLRYCFSFVIFAAKIHLWLKVVFSSTKNNSQKAVFYGYHHIPDIGAPIRGGMVKFQRLNKHLPNTLSSFNILYLGSSALPADWGQITWLASKKKAKLVLNQNGVMYPKHGNGWETINYPLNRLVHRADYVFFQSNFCKMSADKFLGKRSGPSEILYNCVDTDSFTPKEKTNPASCLVLLLGGNQYEFYRLEVALQAVTFLAKQTRLNIRLLVTGELNWINDKKKTRKIAQDLASALDVTRHVEFIGTYSQLNAPDIYNQAHILLHTKHNDPCPGLVVEAMACGLPIVCSESGGVPELVGADAGICIPVEQGWDREIRPDPGLLAEAVLKVAGDLKKYSQAARQRAVDKFDLKPWVKRHLEIFDTLLQ